MFHDPDALARVMSADKTLGQLIIRLAGEINENPLLVEELRDTAQLLGDLMQSTLDKSDLIERRLEAFTGAVS
jgi:hypothetical protein